MSWIAKLVFWTADVVVLVVVAFHIYFMVLEMFLWTTPHGRKKSGYTPERRSSLPCSPPIRDCITAFSQPG